MSDYRPCPSCPDGSVWNSDGPTCRVCPTCGGFAAVHLDGSKLTRAEALGIDEPESKCPHGNPVNALAAKLARCEDALTDTLAALVASTSLLERGGKKAAPSDKMFAIMLNDYAAAVKRGRDYFAASEQEPRT